MKMGVGHLERENYPQALRELLLAEELDPEDALIQLNLGLTYIYRERFDLAEKHTRKALQLNPQLTDATVNLARILIERGRYDEASLFADRAGQDLTYASPEKPLMYKGIALFKMNQFPEARKVLSRSIEYQRDNCLSQNFFGRSLFEQNQHEKAADALDRAAAVCQRLQFDEPQYYAGLSYFQLGQNRKAENRLETLLKFYPNGRYSEKAKQMLEKIRR